MTGSDSIPQPPTPDDLERFVAALPDALREPVGRLAGRPGKGRETLLAELTGYTDRIDAAARRRKDLDVDLAESIRQVCVRLLDDDWAALSEDHRRLVGLACAYYLDAEDGDGDLDSVFGFDDDAELLNRVLDVIGRPEYRVRI